MSATQSRSLTSPDAIRAFYETWLAAWNAHNIDSVLDLMTEDIECFDDGWPVAMKGHNEVRQCIEAAWLASPDMSFELLAGPYVVPGEPRAAFHWRGWGTHTGLLKPPGIAPTGRRWEYDGVDFQEYRGERVCKLRIAFNMLTPARQLGLFPQAGSINERVGAAIQRAGMRARIAVRFAQNSRNSRAKP